MRHKNERLCMVSIDDESRSSVHGRKGKPIAAVDISTSEEVLLVANVNMEIIELPLRNRRHFVLEHDYYCLLCLD